MKARAAVRASACTVLRSGLWARERVPSDPAVPRFTTDAGVELHYEIWAEGEPTLLYVPFWGDSLEWRRWAEPLAAHGVGIVAYERRGTGLSDRPEPTDDNYTVERLTADAVELADSLAAERVVALAGFEGAHQAVRLAAERPVLVSGLVLMGPMLAPVAERPMQVMWEGLIAKGMGYALRSVADLALAELPEEERARFARSLEGHVGADALLAMWRSIDVAESRPFLDRVRCPALVLAGERDIGIPIQWSARVAERLPKGSLVKIHDAGGSMALTHPAEVRAAILEFVRNL
jgi:pimeloyl-ACP methyl ester carboxylesterase